MPDANKQTVIEDGTEFDGTVRSQCGITVSGKLKGELHAPSLEVTASGSVSGKVRVDHLRSHGEVAGEIHAEKVELSGRVSNQTVINAQTLEVKLSQTSGGMQVIFDNCELKVGESQARQVKDHKKSDRHEVKVPHPDARPGHSDTDPRPTF
jgi:cytoskeletal protein CcmA (bactofilin family)